MKYYNSCSDAPCSTKLETPAEAIRKMASGTVFKTASGTPYMKLANGDVVSLGNGVIFVPSQFASEVISLPDAFMVLSK